MKTELTTIWKRFTAGFLMVLVLLHAVGCRYYKVESVSKEEYVNILNIGEIHKYFIVHAGNNLYALNDIKADETAISGNLTRPQGEVLYNEERKKRIKEGEKKIVNEVHLYLNSQVQEVDLGHVEFPLNEINEIKILDRDTGKEIASYALIGLGALVVVSAIVALTKSSCPYVYVHNSENFVFQGETYGGAIGKNLERTDYMPLPSLKADKGNYKIRMSNELKERQYTNLLELVLVEHPEDESVLLDKTGKAHLVGEAMLAGQAHSSAGADLSSLLAEKDSRVHMFNELDFSKNAAVLQFKKPETALQGNLVIRAKNTLWFDYLFGEFLEKFGESYASWMKEQAEDNRENRMQKILDSDFPLSISVKKNGAWEKVDHLLTVGPLAARDFVIPINLEGMNEPDIEVKLETGFMFWELDYAAMDFRESTDVPMITLKPDAAFGTGSIDWKMELERSDDLYMAQERTGEVTEMVFLVPDSLASRSHSGFLKAQGYYELVREFDGLPEWTQLKKFKVPGHFSDFSRERYMDVINLDHELAENSSE